MRTQSSCSKALGRVLILSCVLANVVYTQSAMGQQQQPKPADPPPANQQPKEGADAPDIDEGKPTAIPDSNIVVEPQMQADERPTPPRSEAVDELAAQDQTTVMTGAGVGSDVAYASRGVVELGGSLALTHSSQTTTFRLTPSLGYFFIDNLELTLFPDLTITNVEDSTDVTVGGTIEPSYHQPFSDRIFGFVGIGLGIRYADEPGVDVFLRPRAGMDFMVGRSGILKPALFVDIGANDGISAGGLEVGFTVML